MSGLQVGDVICEVPCEPRDSGKHWVVLGLEDDNTAVDCRLFHPTMSERKLIPGAKVMLVWRNAE